MAAATPPRPARSGLPPGPPLPKAAQTYLLWRHWLPFLERCQRRYGDTFTVRAAPFGTLVYVTRTEDVRRVFTGDRHTFRAGEAHEVLGEPLGRRSLLLLDGDEHLFHRRLMLPPFHGAAVARYADLIREITEEELRTWPLGTPFALLARTQAITLEVILRAVFGIEERERLEELRRLLPRLLDVDVPLRLMWLWPALGRVGRWRRYRELEAQIRALLLDEVRRRRRAPALAERTDVLSLLLGARTEDGEALTDADLVDELLTLLLVGHETTAAAIAWCFERLLRHPAKLARLRAELEAGREDYLEAVVKETLRVRPVLADAVRSLAADAEVAGRRLPRGTIAAASIALVHLSPANYADPRAFRPERFLEGSPPAYAWIPFGGAPRRCLGAALATLEMRVVLATVLERLDVRPARARDERVEVSHITLVPRDGARVVAEHRRPAAPAASANRRAAPGSALPEHVEVAVVGGGAAGLAAAGCLRERGIRAIVLERDCVGSSWRRRYRSLRLNTVRWLSGLPGMAIPRSAGPWPAREEFVAYLERYARERGLDVRTGVAVERVALTAGGHLVETSAGTLRADFVVVATGDDHTPRLPAWPGREEFAGELLHSAQYEHGERYRDRDVLVVGVGNSGAEIALELVACGARSVRAAMRTPPNIAPSRILGVPGTLFGKLSERSPAAIADRMGYLLQRVMWGDLTRHGIPRAPYGVATGIATKGQGPTMDHGFVAAIKAGRIEIVPAVERFEGGEVVLAGGGRLRPDAVIAATGFDPALEPLVGHLGVLLPSGRPAVTGGESHPAAPRLFFNGYRTPMAGALPALGRSSREIARAIARERARAAPTGAPAAAPAGRELAVR